MVLKDKLDTMAIALKLKTENAIHSIKTFLSEKQNGDEALLVKIMLIVIAVIFLVAFRGTVASVISELNTQITTKIKGVYE